MANNIRALREAAKVDKCELARRIGWTRQRVQNIEKQRWKLTDEVKQKVADALGVDASEIVG